VHMAGFWKHSSEPSVTINAGKLLISWRPSGVPRIAQIYIYIWLLKSMKLCSDRMNSVTSSVK
jgi:hypothetical protein